MKKTTVHREIFVLDIFRTKNFHVRHILHEKFLCKKFLQTEMLPKILRARTRGVQVPVGGCTRLTLSNSHAQSTRHIFPAYMKAPLC